MRDRPFGITILAALVALNGVVSLLFGVLDIVRLHLGAGLIAVVWGAVWLFFGLSLWRLRPWARYGTLILAGLYLVFNLIGIFTPLPFNLINVVLSGVVVWYMMRPDIRAAFG